MPDVIKQLIAAALVQQARENEERLDFDFMTLGIDLSTRFGRWRSRGYDAVFQHSPNDAVLPKYRGIRRGNKFLIDHFPTWPIS
jgi:hypothetical protein